MIPDTNLRWVQSPPGEDVFNDKTASSFSVEFSLASLLIDQGYSIAEASHSMGMGESTLRRWVNQLRAERDGITPTANAQTLEPKKSYYSSNQED